MGNNKTIEEIETEMDKIQSECEILMKKTQDEANTKIEKLMKKRVKAYNKQYFFKKKTGDNYPVVTKFYKMNEYGYINYICFILGKIPDSKIPIFNFKNNLSSVSVSSKTKIEAEFGKEITKHEFEIIVNKHMKKIIDI